MQIIGSLLLSRMQSFVTGNSLHTREVRLASAELFPASAMGRRFLRSQLQYWVESLRPALRPERPNARLQNTGLGDECTSPYGKVRLKFSTPAADKRFAGHAFAAAIAFPEPDRQ